MSKQTKQALEPKSFRLLKYQPLTFELKTGRDNNLLIFDEETENTRAIKHCPNEMSIFVDKQSDRAIVKSIIFINGFLNIDGKDVRTIEFLMNHPSRGKVFDVIDDEADAKDALDWEDTILDIKTAIRQKSKEENGIEEIRVVVAALTNDIGGTANMSPAEVRYAAFELVETNPQRFLDDNEEISIFEDASIVRKATAQGAFTSGVVTLSGDARQILWSDNKSPICSVPSGKDYIDYFAQYLGTEDGINVMKELDKR